MARVYGFKTVECTPAEREERRQRNSHWLIRIQCVDCGKRIWKTGLGVANHRRACKG